jgi:hypothetical protein
LFLTATALLEKIIDTTKKKVRIATIVAANPLLLLGTLQMTPFYVKSVS